MNHLNQVLVEGKADLGSVERTGDVMTFILKSTRYTKKDGVSHTMVNEIPVSCGKYFSDMCESNFDSGHDYLRLVGRLDTSEYIKVIPEHIDFRKV